MKKLLLRSMLSSFLLGTSCYAGGFDFFNMEFIEKIKNTHRAIKEQGNRAPDKDIVTYVIRQYGHGHEWEALDKAIQQQFFNRLFEKR